MSSRKAPNLQNYFSSAKQSQQLSEAEAEIQHLKAEIDQLRSSGASELEAEMAKLREQLRSRSGVLEIPVDQIQPNPEQPRQTFSSDSLEAMSRSLDKEGQLQPVILVERDRFILFDGERRWRSAKDLGWKTLRAVMMPEPPDLHRKALLTSLHREDLNPLDKAEAIARELASRTAIGSEDIPRLLSTAVRRLNKQKRMERVVELIAASEEEIQQGLATLELSEPEQAILSGLLDLQLNPASVDANIFPMLSLAADLKIAIRSFGLKGVHAMALQKLSAKNLGMSDEKVKTIREKTTQTVLDKKLSAIQTRKLVAEVIAQNANSSSLAPMQVRQVSRVTTNLQKLSGESLTGVDPVQLKTLQTVLRQKLAEIEALLKEES